MINLKCKDVKDILSQVAGRSIVTPVQPAQMDFLCTKGYLAVMPKEEYDQTLIDVARLTKINEDFSTEKREEERRRLVRQ